MDNVNDFLKIYRGEDFYLTDKIHIRQPDINEICNYGEQRYWSTLFAIVSTPFDMIAQLNNIGIDFTTITDFQLFVLLSRGLHIDETSIFFGDLDFQKAKVIENKEDNSISLVWRDGRILNQYTYQVMAKYLRTIHNIPKPKYTKVANEFTKQKMIEVAQYKFERDKRVKGKQKSILLPLISSLINHPAGKYNHDTVWNLKIYAFFDSIKRIGALENANHLYTGVYSGCVDFEKIDKKELDWMRELS